MHDQTGKDAPGNQETARDVEGRQDPIVARFRPQPTEPAVSGLTLKGALGDSDRPGYRRLYFTSNLDYYAEFSVEDVLNSSRIPPEKSPLLGEEATEITLKRGTNIEYTRNHVVRPPDEFDLNFRRLPLTQPQAIRRGPPDPQAARAVEAAPDTYVPLNGTCWNTINTCPISCAGICTHATCNNTTCTGCCGFSYDDFDPACGPSVIDTACEGQACESPG